MMKKITFVFLLSCALSIAVVHAQESTSELPYSFKNDLPEVSARPKIMAKIDVKSLRAANATKGIGVPLQCGKLLTANFTLANSGVWTTLSNGDRLWRLEIEVPEAMATSLFFDGFYLPQGAKLFVYNKNKTHSIGAFTSRNNQPHKLFATEMVYTSTCIVEYFEPALVKDKGQFRITDVNHVFLVPEFVKNHVNNVDTKGFGGSGSCNVNVNCPEGANWQDQKRAVAKMMFRVGSATNYCSGTLINNTGQNDKPYFLSADHCGGSASASDFSQWVFYFNYEAPTCSNPSAEPQAKTVSGCVQRARSGSGGDGDSDFQLLEFTSPIPASYNVFFAGWDARNTPSPSGVGIHHPAVDIKKISTYTTPLANNDNTHWRVNWVQTQTNWGITEGGSSGSGLFNNAGQLVGDLTGGASACNVPTSSKWDIYGKVSYSWTSNGSTPNRQLKPWLDPNNSGVLTLNGKNQGTTTGTAPVVSITSPANGTTFPAGSSITINAMATDADGNNTITGVTFLANGQVIGTDNTSPYSFTWTGAASGAHQLTARATDNTNLTGTSQTVSVTVSGVTGTAPVATITSPSSGATFPAGSSVTINATATDADGNNTITGVAFLANGQVLGTDNTSPYSFTWANAPSGTHQLTARATDNTNLTGTSAAVTVTVGSAPTGEDITNSPGTISAQYSDSPAGEDIAKVIDNTSSTKYLTFHNSAWIQFQSSGSYVVTRYAITSANDAAERDPLTWTFSGSTNGTSWTTLDTRSNEDFASRLQRREFSFTNSTAYSYYRLQMTNNSGTILQLAEWEIFGTGGTPPTGVATVYQHCSYGGYAIPLPEGTFTLADLISRGMLKDNDISSLRVTSGYRIILYDGDNASGASLIKTADDDCLVNDSFNDRATSVKVEKSTGGGGDWTNFQYPEIVFEDKSPSHPGSAVFHNAIPDPEGSMRAQILEIAKKLHYNVNDNIRTFSTLHFIIEDYDGVAEKWGEPPVIWIRVSTRHINNVFNQGGGNAAIRTEILGILSHEGTHGYQYEPKNAGAYQPGTDFYGFIEGLADYVRISVGLHPGRFPSTGGSWTSGYTTSGFFINWIVNNKDKDFAIKFQHTARTYSTWSWNAACQEILGESVQSLWNQYQASINKAASLAGVNEKAYAMDAHMSCVPNESTALHVNEEQSFSAYPNPTRKSINIELSQGGKAEVSFTSGMTVKRAAISGAKTSVDIGDLPSGTYMMTIKDEKGNVHKERIVVPD
jgi:hypothetical protein